jgi:acyl carrier protein phosphodiesterase
LNFLAHIYLSFDHPGISIGNFMADGLKRQRLEHFPTDFQKGVMLHRAIDEFTDQHPIFKKSCKRIFKVHGHYSRVIVDIFYDHFLAVKWANYHSLPLEVFAQDFYTLLDNYFEELPLKTQHLFPYMKKQNWLVAYKKIEGIDQILKGMQRRTKFSAKLDEASKDLIMYYTDFENDFDTFFKELIIFSKASFDTLK